MERLRTITIATSGLAALLAAAALAAQSPSSDAASPATADAQPVEAIAAIVAEFADHPVVAIGESHDLAEAGDLYRALVRDGRIAAGVDAVVVEFGNARYQPLIDDYVAGASVARARLRRVWRDTTQVGGWDAPMYAAFFAAVRKANAKRPPGRQLRVLLGDPPIDWSRVRRQRQWRVFARDRERFMAKVIERQVLAKGQKALVLAGLSHVTHGGGGVSDLVESRVRGSVFVAGIHLGFPSQAWEERLGSWPRPALAALAGTWIGALPQGDHLAQDSLDALLYLGPPSALHLSVPLPTVYRDDRYWRELRARFELAGGRPFSARALFAAYSSPPYPSSYDPGEIARQQRFAQCMRDEGVEAFPDPEVQFDAIGFFGEAIADARKDPDFETAQRACATRVLQRPPPGNG